MSASIVRNIVASVIGCDSRIIKLSGTAPDNLYFPNWGGFCYDSRYESTKLFYFSPLSGLKEFELQDSNEYDGGVSLKELSNSIELQKSLFLVVIRNSCNQMQNPQNHDYEYSCTIYKSPNFKEIYEKYEEEEIARWEQWIQS